MNKLAFKCDGKPRGWLRKLLFHRNRQPRKVFQRVVYKKNGKIRPEFQHWMLMSATHTPNREQSQSATVDVRVLATLNVLQSLKPLDQAAKSWTRRDSLKKLANKEELVELLSPANNTDLVLSFSHDNYREHTGGVQLCILREEKVLTSQSYSYLNIHPWQPLMHLAARGVDPVVSLVLNGVQIADCKCTELAAAVSTLAQQKLKMHAIVHHLMGHSPESVASIIRASKVTDCLFWLHDFFSLCPSFNLQRNGVAQCSAPARTSNACAICVFGNERQDHLPRMEEFFHDVPVRVLSPSKVTLDFWKRRVPYGVCDSHIVPHLELDVTTDIKPVATVVPDRPVKMAFMGTPVWHKGWHVFDSLAHNSVLQSRFEFVAFAASKLNSTVRRIAVRTGAGKLDAMTSALLAENVDLALIWPSWPETFSFTTFEAFAAGAYVITNADSGNVAVAVAESGRGVVLKNDTELLEFLIDGRAEKLASQSRAARNTQKIAAR
ncbi:MAG: hypothetical protein JKY94_09530, partial [Rhodobacteraceae bacterium]|nr:hypothetical protein [Paracoccaceae bacterium]